MRYFYEKIKISQRCGLRPPPDLLASGGWGLFPQISNLGTFKAFSEKGFQKIFHAWFCCSTKLIKV